MWRHRQPTKSGDMEEIYRYAPLPQQGNSLITIEDYYHSAVVPTDPEIVRKLRRKIMKNVVLIALVWILTFTAYNGLANLQSSLHKDHGMGTVTQSLLYTSALFSSLFLPKLMTTTLGTKRTMLICIAGYMTWMVANGYAVWATMIPTSVIVGLCVSPLWTAQKIYFAKIVPKYAALTKEKDDVVMSRMFGIFYGLCHISSVIGSIISSTVMQPASLPHYDNNTELPMQCGMNDCPWNNFTLQSQSNPTTATVWSLVAIYLLLSTAAMVIICVCVDDLPGYMCADKLLARRETKKHLVATILHMRHPTMLLLIGITMFTGLENSFFSAEWSNSYVSCSLGIWMVGYTSIPASILSTFSTFLGGYAQKRISRVHIFTVGFLAHIFLNVSLMLWKLDKDKVYVFYLISACRSVADGIYQTQINSLYGTLFIDNTEVAFSGSALWGTLGNAMGFGYSSLLCTNIKLYILTGFLIVGNGLYYVVEWLEARKFRDQLRAIDALSDGTPDIGEFELDVHANNSHNIDKNELALDHAGNGQGLDHSSSNYGDGDDDDDDDDDDDKTLLLGKP